MEIEIWSDVTCPFCYIGKHNFELALQQVRAPHSINVRWRSFELDPHAAKDYPGTLYDWLATRYGKTLEQVVEMNKPIIQHAASLGLIFNLDRVRPTNSFDAHRLLHAAATDKKEWLLANGFFKAFFTEGKNISDHAVLLDIAMHSGLQKDYILDVLQSDKFEKEVKADEKEARQLAIRGVPYFLINRRSFVSGSQPVDVFLKILQQSS